MKIKKWLLFAAGMMAMSTALTACSTTKTSTKATSAAQTAASETAETTANLSESTEIEDAGTQKSASAENSGKKTLVVYYSASGNTARVAKAAAEAAGADLFEIVPEEPYTSADLNWSNADSRVSKEHDDESLRDVPLVSTEVENWDSYDTVLLGYPIWWGIAAWPTDGFVKANDFTGKTVIPFCTAASSGIGQSGELLAELAGTGDWQEGIRFSSGVSDEDVAEWIDELGLGSK